jgi:hypothetical protein
LKKTRVLGRLWYGEPNDAVEYAKFFSRAQDALIRVYDAAGTGDQKNVARNM